jgi:hypothetical protein
MPKSTIPTILIHNVETGEIIEREMNEIELAQNQLDKENSTVEKQLEINKETARQAILDRLGLTADEAAILLG